MFVREEWWEYTEDGTFHCRKWIVFGFTLFLSKIEV